MSSNVTRQLFETLRFHLGEWDLTLLLVKTPDVKEPKDCWFSIRPICDQLGLIPTRQRERIKSDQRFHGSWRELPVQTDAGYRSSFCLRIEKIGLWFTLINPQKVNARFRDRLEMLQADIERKAAEAVLGEAAVHLLAPSSTNATSSDQLISVARGEMYFHCPKCKTPLCLIMDGSGVHIIAGDEAP
jgi:P22_AR N-terminal domain